MLKGRELATEERFYQKQQEAIRRMDAEADPRLTRTPTPTFTPTLTLSLTLTLAPTLPLTCRLLAAYSHQPSDFSATACGR